MALMQYLYRIFLKEFFIYRERASYLFDVLSLVFYVSIFYFIGMYVGRNYTQFVLVGLFFQMFFHSGLFIPEEILREERLHSTIELNTHRFGLLRFILFSTIFRFFFRRFPEVVLFFIFLILMDLFTFKILVYSFVSFLFVLPVGLISCGLYIAFRRAGIFLWITGNAIDLLSGVYFPTELLPDFIQSLIRFLPSAIVLEKYRNMLGFGFFDCLIFVFWWVVAIVIFRASLEYARSNGCLCFKGYS